MAGVFIIISTSLKFLRSYLCAITTKHLPGQALSILFSYSYLEITLTKTVRDHDKANAFNFALLGSPENVNTVLEFVKNNIARIRAS